MLKETIESELKQALKAGEQLKLSVLRMLSAAIHNREIDKRSKIPRPPAVAGIPAEGLGTGTSELTDAEVVAVIRQEAKKRRDAIAEFGRGGRNDLVAQESAEFEILESYLPPELSDAELSLLIAEGMQTIGVSSEKEFGKLMGWVMGRVEGRASGERVAALIRRTIASP